MWTRYPIFVCIQTVFVAEICRNKHFFDSDKQSYLPNFYQIKVSRVSL